MSQICPKKVFPVEKSKTEHHHWILQIQISLIYQILTLTKNFKFLDQICHKRVLPVKNGKSEHHHCILHIRVTLSTKFHFIQTILSFVAKFAQEVYRKRKIWTWLLNSKFQLQQMFVFWNKFLIKQLLPVETEKNEHHQWILHVRISLSIKFLLWRNNFKFWDQIYQKRVFLVENENEKSEHYRWILHIWNSLSNKFQHKLKNFDFLVQLCPKKYFHWKTEKVKITIEFCIFEAV